MYRTDLTMPNLKKPMKPLDIRVMMGPTEKLEGCIVITPASLSQICSSTFSVFSWCNWPSEAPENTYLVNDVDMLVLR